MLRVFMYQAGSLQAGKINLMIQTVYLTRMFEESCQLKISVPRLPICDSFPLSKTRIFVKRLWNACIYLLNRS
jgi:hypothetical protein